MEKEKMIKATEGAPAEVYLPTVDVPKPHPKPLFEYILFNQQPTFIWRLNE